MVEKITQALVAAYKKDRDGYTDNVFVTLDEDALHMYAQKEVVDDVISPQTEVTLDAARKIDPTVQLGDLINVDIRQRASAVSPHRRQSRSLSRASAKRSTA